jgi:hypothetical protein
MAITIWPKERLLTLLLPSLIVELPDKNAKAFWEQMPLNKTNPIILP